MSHTQCHPFKSVSYEANIVALAVRNRRTGVAVYDLDRIRPEDMPLLCTLLTLSYLGTVGRETQQHRSQALEVTKVL